jgi:tRNA-specific 2-thiouridylase
MSGVVVGLSGGVDSAVAALVLCQAGHEVRGATLELWPGDGERSCCSPAATRRALAVAGHLRIPHDVVDEHRGFATAVVDPFVASYLGGQTPNPCVDCNPWRLARLVALAEAAGAAHVATGHYARLVRRAGRLALARGADRSKDQSYMLWRVTEPVLERLLLPLGESTKEEVRSRARRAGLPVAAAPESQEVCFAPDGYRAFLAACGVDGAEGEIVDADGRLLGHHQGVWNYTVGQRRGLGVAGRGPLYVLGVDAAAARVVVGGRAELEVDEVEVRGLVDRGLDDGEGLEVQLRYRAGAVGVRRLRRLPADRARLELTEPFAGPAPGQAAVFYRDDVVVGGAVVASSPLGRVKALGRSRV